MLRVSVNRLRPGTMLARDLYDAQGNILLRAMVPLTEGYIESLMRRGFAAVYIHDRDTNDVDIQETVSERVRLQARVTVQEVYEVARKAIADAVEQREPMNSAVQSGAANLVKAEPLFRQLEAIVQTILRELASTDMLSGIAEIRSHDDRTFGHSIEVSITALMIGKRLYMTERDLVKLGTGCILHDIGKLFVDKEILRRRGPLNKRAYRKLKEHTSLGYQLLKTRNPDTVLINHVAFQHHERQDGRGYPRRLRGTNTFRRRTLDTNRHILPFAEIAAVADVYDTLSSERPGKPVLAPQTIQSIMREMSGAILNAEFTHHFLSMLPLFPVGIGVVVKTGFYKGYRGIVVRANPRYPDRPAIRLLYDDAMERIAPVELNLSREPGILVSTVQQL